MADFRIQLDIKDVTEGDATGVAQEIWEKYADELDAKLGDFAVSVHKNSGGFTSLVDWQPDE